MYRPPSSSGPIVGGSIGGLAVTGADVVWWIAAGVMALLVGLFLLRMARRRVAGPASGAAAPGRPAGPTASASLPGR